MFDKTEHRRNSVLTFGHTLHVWEAVEVWNVRHVDYWKDDWVRKVHEAKLKTDGKVLQQE